MHRKILAAALALTVVIAGLAGCADSGKPGENTDDTGKLQAAYDAVVEAYGDNYYPNAPVEADILEATYGIKPEWVKEYKAEMPLISVNVDTFIGIEAAQGHAEDVENALNTYREYLVNDSMQYPMNMPKVKASEVLRIRDHVFFVMLGGEIMADTEEEGEAQAKEKNEIGINAIKEVFGVE